VLPFILRAVTLVGINSVEASPADRGEAWTLLAAQLDSRTVADIAPRTVPLAQAASVGAEVLAGTVAGRVVVDVRA
jgi:acrylyl-CoA reductase (NADPH)